VNFWYRLPAAASLVVGATLLRGAFAEVPERPASIPREEPVETAPVMIVLVGPAGQSSELVALVSELLGRRELETSFLREREFQPHELLADRERDLSVWVYVALGGGQSARLYFRGPGGQRFLLRELGIPGGLDAVGREGIAQVIDSSIYSLLHSSAGLSREQARDAIEQAQRETAPTPQPTATPPPSAAPLAPQPAPVPSAKAPPSNVAGLVGIRYSAEYSGSGLGTAHGPGIELGLGFRGRARIGARFSGERFFPQSIESAKVGASIQTTRLLLGGNLDWPLGTESALVLGFAGGTDITRIDPQTHGPSVTLASASTDVVPVAQAGARVELRPGSWSLGVGLLATVALADTRYDLRRPDGTTRVAGLSTVRPGAVIGFGWMP
jgi:hypothetical protein